MPPLTSSTRKAQATKEIAEDIFTVNPTVAVSDPRPDFFAPAIIDQPKKDSRVQQKRHNILRGALRVLDDYTSAPSIPQAEFAAAFSSVEQAIMAIIPNGTLPLTSMFNNKG